LQLSTIEELHIEKLYLTSVSWPFVPVEVSSVAGKFAGVTLESNLEILDPAVLFRFFGGGLSGGTFGADSKDNIRQCERRCFQHDFDLMRAKTESRGRLESEI
jgi:hypothetical protein